MTIFCQRTKDGFKVKSCDSNEYLNEANYFELLGVHEYLIELSGRRDNYSIDPVGYILNNNSSIPLLLIMKKSRDHEYKTKRLYKDSFIRIDKDYSSVRIISNVDSGDYC